MTTTESDFSKRTAAHIRAYDKVAISFDDSVMCLGVGVKTN